MIRPHIEMTQDGSPTLRHPVLDQYYHSTRGALGEALHVYIEHGFRHATQRCEGRVMRILEVGFGSGLNAYLSALEAERMDQRVEYYSVELYPIEESVAEQLHYGEEPLFMELHRASWERLVEITPHFSLQKMEVALENCALDATFDLIYFDAFAPDAQPELWSEAIFQRLYDALSDQGTLVTYSAKGLVKQNLRGAGFEIKRLPGALGKIHMLRAQKTNTEQDERA